MSDTPGTDGPKSYRMTFTDGRGDQVRKVNMHLDVGDFKGLAGFPWLLMAANPHLSVTDLVRAYLHIGGGKRSRSWFDRRRWLFVRDRPPGAKPDLDGLDMRARELMAEHSTRSAREVSRLLKAAGINRSREWVRRHRCEGAHTDTQHPI